MQKMESKVIEVGKQMVANTYKALVNDESPLATRLDHLKLQHQVDNINSQLAQIIRMMTTTTTPQDQPRNDHEPMPFSPPRTGKRPNQNRTPEKNSSNKEWFTQETAVSSAASDLDARMEGCED